MNRKTFLSSIGLLSLSKAVEAAAKAEWQLADQQIILPRYLEPGDKTGFTSPAGYISLDEIQPAKLLMESWGFEVAVGAAIGKRSFTFGGSDEERRSDFQRMLDDPSIKAIMCARGGYGMVRIIDQLKWDKFRKSPKWIIGFSDITVIHCHLNRQLRIASIHSKMCNSFPDVWEAAEPVQVETINSIKHALTGTKIRYEAPVHVNNRFGVKRGQLIGGNLSILETLSGTSSAVDTRGKILFLEDTGEYLYRVDRMMWNLKRSGMLSGLAGLIVGNIETKADDPGEEFGETIHKIILDKVKEFSYPVCFDFPVGHQRNNVALKCGVMHELSVTASGTSLVSLF